MADTPDHLERLAQVAREAIGGDLQPWQVDYLRRVLAGRSEPTPLVDATNEALAAAGDAIADRDAGTVQAILDVAMKVDMADRYFEDLADDAAVSGRRPPSQDNVSLPTYLKYADALGLTPAARARMAPKPEPTREPKREVPAVVDDNPDPQQQRVDEIEAFKARRQRA